MADSNASSRANLRQVKWTIRRMQQKDIDKCLSIWSRVELTEAHQTVSSSLAADPEGFYVAQLDSTGKLSLV